MSTDPSSTESIKNNSAEAAQTLKSEASKLAGTAQSATETLARDKAEEARGEVTARTNSVEHAVDDIASTLGEHSDTLGQYASEFSDSLSSFNDKLKNRSLDELASDARTLAKDNPAMFMLGAVTIGAIAARFFQASAPPSSSSSSTHYRTDATTTAGSSSAGFDSASTQVHRPTGGYQ